MHVSPVASPLPFYTPRKSKTHAAVPVMPAQTLTPHTHNVLTAGGWRTVGQGKGRGVMGQILGQ